MIKETLEVLSPGTRSFLEMAKQLNIGLEELKQRLSILENGGYIHQIRADGCSNIMCRGCGCSGGCAKASQEATVYHLTAKGKKAIRRA